MACWADAACGGGIRENSKSNGKVCARILPSGRMSWSERRFATNSPECSYFLKLPELLDILPPDHASTIAAFISTNGYFAVAHSFLILIGTYCRLSGSRVGCCRLLRFAIPFIP